MDILYESLTSKSDGGTRTAASVTSVLPVFKIDDIDVGDSFPAVDESPPVKPTRKRDRQHTHIVPHTTIDNLESLISPGHIETGKKFAIACVYGVAYGVDFIREVNKLDTRVKNAYVIHLKNPTEALLFSFGFSGFFLPERSAIQTAPYRSSTKEERLKLGILMQYMNPTGEFDIRANHYVIDGDIADARIVQTPDPAEMKNELEILAKSVSIEENRRKVMLMAMMEARAKNKPELTQPQKKMRKLRQMAKRDFALLRRPLNQSTPNPTESQRRKISPPVQSEPHEERPSADTTIGITMRELFGDEDVTTEPATTPANTTPMLDTSLSQLPIMEIGNTKHVEAGKTGHTPFKHLHHSRHADMQYDHNRDQHQLMSDVHKHHKSRKANRHASHKKNKRDKNQRRHADKHHTHHSH